MLPKDLLKKCKGFYKDRNISQYKLHEVHTVVTIYNATDLTSNSSFIQHMTTISTVREIAENKNSERPLYAINILTYLSGQTKNEEIRHYGQGRNCI